MAADVTGWYADEGDAMEGRSIRCELVMDSSGRVTVIRAAGCTHADVVELCRLVVEGDPVVHELPGDGEPDRG